MSDRIHPDDYDIERVRDEWVGKLAGTSEARYPVEHDPIGRHCDMVGDTNPLFLDPDEAAAGPHGAVVLPPSMLPVYIATGGPLPKHPAPAEEDSAESRPGFTFGGPTPGERVSSSPSPSRFW